MATVKVVLGLIVEFLNLVRSIKDGERNEFFKNSQTAFNKLRTATTDEEQKEATRAIADLVKHIR